MDDLSVTILRGRRLRVIGWCQGELFYFRLYFSQMGSLVDVLQEYADHSGLPLTAEAADEILAAIRAEVARAIGFEASESLKICGRTSIIRRGKNGK